MFRGIQRQTIVVDREQNLRNILCPSDHLNITPYSRVTPTSSYVRVASIHPDPPLRCYSRRILRHLIRHPEEKDGRTGGRRDQSYSVVEGAGWLAG